MTLMELTHHESGIIIHGNNIMVDNWQFYDDDVFPALFAGGMVGYPSEKNSVEAMQNTARRVEHIRDTMPDAKNAVIDYDANGDLPRIYSGEDDEPGTVYDLPDGGLLIVPDDWA